MSLGSWKLLLAFGGFAWLVSRWSPEAAGVMVLTLGAVTVFTHSSQVAGFFGQSTAP